MVRARPALRDFGHTGAADRADRAYLVQGLRAGPSSLRRRRYRQCHLAAAWPDRLEAVARGYGPALGSPARAPDQFSLGLSERARLHPALAHGRVNRSPTATARAPAATGQDLPRSHVLQARL